MKRVIVIGAGGHGKVIADIIRLSGDEVVGFIDDKNPSELPDFNIVGTTADIGKCYCWYFPAVGECDTREHLMMHKVKWYTAIHPASTIAQGVKIGEGSCVMANSVINPGAVLGKGVIVNTAATIDHDCRISSFVHIAPGAHISGSVSVGEKCWIGIGALICNNIDICSGCIIGAGTVIIKNIDEVGTYVGVPSRKIR